MPTRNSEDFAIPLTAPRGTRRQYVLLGALIAAAVGIPVILSIWTGSLAIPHNDAWSHSKIAQTFSQSGTWEFLGWNRTALIGQIVILGPLASSIIGQQVSVAALGAVALVSVYLYARSRIGWSRALLATGVVAAAPEFGLLSTSFMSDVPALAGIFLGLLLTDLALRRGSGALFAAALLVELWAATVREQSIVALVATVIVVAMRWRSRRRLAVILLGSLAWAFFILFELWRRSQPFGDPPVFALDPALVGGALIRTPLTFGLLLLPIVLLVATPRSWSRSALTGALVAVALSSLFAIKRHGDVFLGNYLSPHGAYSAVLAGEREVLSAWIWIPLVVLSIAGLGLLVGQFIQRGIRADPLTMIVLMLLAVGTLAQLISGQMIFARYLLPALPLLSIILLRTPERPRWARSLVTLGLLAGVSLLVTANALAFDAARWHLAEELVSSGVPATNIDAGLEWNGYHWQGPYRPDSTPPLLDRVTEDEQCRVMSPNEIPGKTPLTSEAYPTFAFGSSSYLWVYDCRA